MTEPTAPRKDLSQLNDARPAAGRRRGLWIGLAAAAVVAALAVTGIVVATRPGDTAAEPGVTAGEPVSGGTLRFGWLGYPESIDPHLNTSFAATNYANNIVDKLTFQDPDTGEITPWLATEWETNDELTEFTFTLREDVTFSDGTPFTAESVKHNFDQYVHGDEALGIKPNGATHLQGYVETRVDDDHVVTIVFDRPYASFLQFLSYSANNQPGFLADATLEKSAEERLQPENIIATGPFTVTDYVPQESVRLERRDDYDWGPEALGHEGAAYLDAIELITIPEASVRTGSLQAGDIDASFDIQPTDEPVLAQAGYGLTSRVIGGLNVSLAFNASLPQTSDIAVRQAIIRATNREGYKQTVLSESEAQAKSILSETVPGYLDYSDTALRFDLEEAAAILDEAGWLPGEDGVREKDGVELRLKATGINLLVSARPAYESLQADLASIGIQVEFTFDTGNLSQDQLSQEYHLINNNRTRNDIAILNVNFNPTRGNVARIPADFEGYDDIVQRLEAVESTLDTEERAAIAEDVQDLLLDEYALTDPIFVPSQIAAYDPSVHGIILDSSTRLLFVDTWIEASE